MPSSVACFRLSATNAVVRNNAQENIKIIGADEEVVFASQRSFNTETLVSAGQKSDEWFSLSA
jgi:hypothetical protein